MYFCPVFCPVEEKKKKGLESWRKRKRRKEKVKEVETEKREHDKNKDPAGNIRK